MTTTTKKRVTPDPKAVRMIRYLRNHYHVETIQDMIGVGRKTGYLSNILEGISHMADDKYAALVSLFEFAFDIHGGDLFETEEDVPNPDHRDPLALHPVERADAAHRMVADLLSAGYDRRRLAKELGYRDASGLEIFLRDPRRNMRSKKHLALIALHRKVVAS